jgi:hypothetical protein
MLLLLAVNASSCGSWVTHDGPPERVIRATTAKSVRVTRLDGIVMEIDHPFTSGDSLIGSIPGVEPRQRVAVPFDQIEAVERWRDETAVAVLIGGGIGILLFFSILPVWGVAD